MASDKNITMRQYNGTDYDTLYPKNTSQQVLLNDNVLANLYGLSMANPTVNDALYNIGAADVTITAVAGHTITATDGVYSLTKTVGSNCRVVFKIVSFGTWTFTDNNSSASGSLTIDALKEYTLSLMASLENSSWSDISIISNAGLATEAFDIGDTKTVLIDNDNYEMQIIGFNHDTKTAGGTAGITFQFKQSYNTPYYMNSTDTMAGGWAISYMRLTVMPLLLSKLPSELQNVIVPVEKRTNATSKSINLLDSTDSLWLLSEVEVFGTTYWSTPGEGTQYAFYSAGNTVAKTKQDTQAANWWERSPSYSEYIADTRSFCCVSAIPYQDSYMDAATANATQIYTGGGSVLYDMAVAPAFCI